MMGPEALGRLLDGHAGALTLYARQWCAVPDDVVQEAFIKLLGQRPAPDEPVAWLYRVVRNGAISASRGARRRQRLETARAATTPVWIEATEEQRLDGDAVTAALQDLPIEQREAIVAHLWGGLTFEQIARLAGSSSSTVHRHYAAGLVALRERLKLPCPTKPAT
ncbi:MAG: RNA polymerase sigma factor [Gemmataceae bacterium]